ncbi:hypothetical protein CDL12_19550 [Handroanthus impetiginosus]|uniref:Uncharacterized protein n=1 Tax=Handroanthus impetiginosus TaxID=429701 RepID=A0A2G9GRG2_9LAMI|nr:hypothetical protein CDL12_19550 [Handroanthus impetiginosus]
MYYFENERESTYEINVIVSKFSTTNKCVNASSEMKPWKIINKINNVIILILKFNLNGIAASKVKIEIHFLIYSLLMVIYDSNSYILLLVVAGKVRDNTIYSLATIFFDNMFISKIKLASYCRLKRLKGTIICKIVRRIELISMCRLQSLD